MLWLISAALGNGLTTHVTISEFALENMNEGGLADILRREDLWWILQNGTQFPDGGYPLGEAYAETAHWEPFQDRYLEWIRAEYDGDYSSEVAQEHVAFLMGLASHGMGDQVFDALYMQRAYVYDAGSDWENLSMDTSTDVAISALTGGQVVQDTWIPHDAMVALMAEAGVTVTADTLDQGQDLTHIAIAFGAAAASSYSMQTQHASEFPWAYEHILDYAVPGSPEWEAQVVARYWQVRWARLNGASEPIEPVIFTFPQDGERGHETDAAMVESRLTLVFSRGLVNELILPDFFTVVDMDGNNYVVTPWVFYGYGSHVVHLSSEVGWPDDSDFYVTAHAGVPFIDGSYSGEEYRFGFSTKDPPSEVEEAPPADPACGCSAGGSSAGLGWIAAMLLGYRRDRLEIGRHRPFSSA